MTKSEEYKEVLTIRNVKRSDYQKLKTVAFLSNKTISLVFNELMKEYIDKNQHILEKFSE